MAQTDIRPRTNIEDLVKSSSRTNSLPVDSGKKRTRTQAALQDVQTQLQSTEVALRTSQDSVFALSRTSWEKTLEINRLEKKIEGQTLRIAALCHESQRHSRLPEDLRKAQARVHILTTQLNQSRSGNRSKSHSLRRSKDSRDRAKKHARSLRVQLGSQQAALSLAQQQLAEAQQNSQYAYYQLGVLQQSSEQRDQYIALLQAQLSALQSDVVMSTSTENEATQKADYMRLEIQQLRAELCSSTSQQSISRNRVESLEKLASQATTKWKEEEAVSQELRAEVRDLARKLRRAKLSEQISKAKTTAKVTKSLKTISLKKKGIFTEECRKLIRRLDGAGLSQRSIGKVVQAVGDSLGITINGSISARSVSRVVLEGGIASEIQLGEEMLKAQSLTPPFPLVLYI